MFQKKPSLKQALVVATFFVLVVVGGMILYNRFRAAVIVISSDANAVISITTKKGGVFNEVGRGEVTHRTNHSGSLFIKSKLGEKESITGLTVRPRDREEINIELKNKVDVVEAYQGGVSDGIRRDSLVQGIEPTNSSITSFDTEKFTPPKFSFATVPYLKKIVWQSVDSFVYSSFSSGVGKFSENRDLGAAGVAKKISTRNSIEQSLLGANGGSDFWDISRFDQRPLTLLGNDGLYISEDFGANVEKVSHIDGLEENSSLFTANNAVFVVRSPLPAEYASEAEGETEAEHAHHSTLLQYNYDGVLVAQQQVHEGVESIYETRGNYIVFGSQSMDRVSSDGQVTELPFYFRDISATHQKDETIYVIADGSLWQYNAKDNTFNLLSEGDGEYVGLSGSFYDYDSRIYYAMIATGSSSATQTLTHSFSPADQAQ